MSRFIHQAPTLRRLARVYRRLLRLAVPAAFAACQGGADSLAPDAPGDPSAPAIASTTEAEPAPGQLGTLVSSRIAFMPYTLNGSDIWTMDPQGGSLAHLTSFTGSEMDPHWSHDHTRIAFSRLRNGVPDIYLMNADGTNKHWARATTYPSSIDEPSWSPDGTRLLVRVKFQGMYCLAKLDLASGNLALVAPAGVFGVQGGWPTYDPTGKTIFYVDNTGKTIKRFTPGGSQTTVFTSSGYVSQLAISPDGTRLVYTAGVDPNSELYVLDLATKVAKRLTNNGVSDRDPTWSPDGTRLAFASGRSGKMQIWTMNSSTGGSPTRITSKTYGAGWPSWAN